MKKYSLLLLTLIVTSASARTPRERSESVDSSDTFYLSSPSASSGMPSIPSGGPSPEAHEELRQLREGTKPTTRERPSSLVAQRGAEATASFVLTNNTGQTKYVWVTGKRPKHYTQVQVPPELRVRLKNGRSIRKRLRSNRRYYIFEYSDKKQSLPENMWSFVAGKDRYLMLDSDNDLTGQPGEPKGRSVTHLAYILNGFRLEHLGDMERIEAAVDEPKPKSLRTKPRPQPGEEALEPMGPPTRPRPRSIHYGPAVNEPWLK